MSPGRDSRSARGRPREWIFRLLAASAGICGALLVGEIALRVADWPAPGFYPGGKGPVPIRTPSGEGGAWREHPGPARFLHYDYDIATHVNRHGFRERDDAGKRSGERRIGVFGDSFAAGTGVGSHQRLGEVWLDTLGAVRPDATLWNFASPWSGTWQQAEFLRGAGAEYQLDEVILAVYSGNELQDNARWEALRELSEAELAALDAARNRPFRNWMRSHVRLASFVWVKLARGLLASPHESGIGEETVERLWPSTERALRAFRQAVGARDWTIWYLPSRGEWERSPRAPEPDRGRSAAETRHYLRDRFGAWASAHGVRFIDTTPWLLGQSAETMLFPRDGHWNALAHRHLGTRLGELDLARLQVGPGAVAHAASAVPASESRASGPSPQVRRADAGPPLLVSPE